MINFDALLKKLGLRKKSLVERVTDRVKSGRKPSAFAASLFKDITADEINAMFLKATTEYNRTHGTNLFDLNNPTENEPGAPVMSKNNQDDKPAPGAPKS